MNKIALGVMHPRDRCALCGSRYGTLDMVVLAATRAWAMVCRDTSACMRRQTRARQGRLFGDAA